MKQQQGLAVAMHLVVVVDPLDRRCASRLLLTHAIGEIPDDRHGPRASWRALPGAAELGRRSGQWDGGRRGPFGRRAAVGGSTWSPTVRGQFCSPAHPWKRGHRLAGVARGIARLADSGALRRPPTGRAAHREPGRLRRKHGPPATRLPAWVRGNAHGVDLNRNFPRAQPGERRAGTRWRGLRGAGHRGSTARGRCRSRSRRRSPRRAGRAPHAGAGLSQLRAAAASPLGVQARAAPAPSAFRRWAKRSCAATPTPSSGSPDSGVVPIGVGSTTGSTTPSDVRVHGGSEPPRGGSSSTRGEPVLVGGPCHRTAALDQVVPACSPLNRPATMSAESTSHIIQALLVNAPITIAKAVAAVLPLRARCWPRRFTPARTARIRCCC